MCVSVKSINYQINTKIYKRLSIWIPTSYTSPMVLSVSSHMLPRSNSRIPTLGAKLSKMPKKISLVKTVIELQNYILLVNTSPGIWLVSEMEPRITSYNNFTKIETHDLPRKMWFLMDAHFEILRSPLRSWRQNESIAGLIF